MKGHYWGIVWIVALIVLAVLVWRGVIDIKTAAGIASSLTTFLMPSPVPIAMQSQVRPPSDTVIVKGP